jgi:predicted GIY-YIG superfamily endonuclease
MVNIFEKILYDDYIVKESLSERSYMNGVKCLYDESDYDFKDLHNKYVVYYIKTNNYHYFGRTNCLDRRINEHLRTDDKLFPYFKKDFIIKPIKVFTDEKECLRFEKQIRNKAFLCLKKEELINTI